MWYVDVYYKVNNSESEKRVYYFKIQIGHLILYLQTLITVSTGKLLQGSER